MITPPNINESQLRGFLSRNYGLEVIAITFLPKGETSWVYIVETNKGKYLLKLYKSMLPFLEKATELTHKLYSDYGINQIVHTIKARNNKTVTIFENYPVALSNFIDGKEILEQQLTNKQIEELGKIIGKIHAATPAVHDYPTKEIFESKDRDMFLKVAERIKGHSSEENDFQRELVDILMPKREKILEELTKLEEVGNRLKAKNLPFVICHSDLTSGNILIDSTGALYLIDWDTPILAPKERDLFFFQDRKDICMKGYIATVGETTLDQDALAFYRYEWNVQEIADFGENIFFQNNSEEQNKHALAKVKEFLDYSGI